jgi:thioesterase domain-containing protein
MSTEAIASGQVMVPATPMQESMWWIHHRSTINSVYNLTWRMSCGAEVDLAGLQAAWQAVHDRHDALRSGLHQQDGSVFMLVLPAVTAELEHVVIAEPAAGPASAGRLLALIAEELHERPFDLDRPPLTRLTLVSVGDQHELVLTIHHSMIDGWGLQLLLADLSHGYRSALGGEPPSFPADAPSFADYGRRSLEAREKGRWQPGIEHWRSALSGAVSSVVMADRQRASRVGGRGEVVHHVFGRGAQAGVEAAARRASATPFAVLLAAFGAMLARGGAGPDVAVGVATADRMTKRDQALVGYVSNVCISRARVRDCDQLGDLVEQARDGLWTMLAYQDVPFPLVFGALDERDQARLRNVPPLLISYYGPIAAGLRLGDVPLALMPSPNRAARSDISFGVMDTDDGQAVEVEYDTERYDRQTVLRLLADIETVLAAAARPATRVGDLAVQTRTWPADASGGAAPRPEPDRPAGSAPAGALDQAFRLWTGVLGAPPADADEDFFASIGRSIKAIELVAAIEAESGREFDVESWLARPTPRQIARLLDPQAQPTASAPVPEESTLAELRAGGGLHLHLVPGAAAGPGSYAELIEVLPEDWRLTISQEQEPARSVADMAGRYRADLDSAGLRPDLLAGWSVGGQIAYQMATRYDPAPAVALLDSPPPVGYALTDEEVRQAFTAALLGSLARQPGAAQPRIRADGPDVHLRVLAAYLAAAGQAIPFAILAQRWSAYDRQMRAAAAHLADRRVAVPSLVVAAELADEQLDQWEQRFEPAPRRLRLATDHPGVVRHPAVDEVGAAMAALARRAGLGPARPL